MKVMLKPKLLADETPDPKTNKAPRFSRLGKLLHVFSKYMIRATIDRMHNKMKPVINYKRINGFVNPEMKLLYDDITWLIELDRNGPRSKELQHNIRMFENLRDIFCCTIDEDTWYLIRFWVLMHRIHEDRWNEHYSVAMNRSDSFFNYQNIYNNMRLRNEPLKRLEK